MKNFLFFLLGLTLICNLNGQTISIPSPTFEQALINAKIDTIPIIDGLAKIKDISKITSLLLTEKNISDLSGIKGFTNLEILYCGKNNFTTLDVSGMNSLQRLHAFNGQLNSINFLGCNNLQTLDVYDNLFTSLDVNELKSLKTLFCHNNQLTNLNVSGANSLQSLICDKNQLTDLDISNLNNLKELRCAINKLTVLDASNLTNLESIICFDNQLTNINLEGSNSLRYLQCEVNEIDSLDLNEKSEIYALICWNNNLTELDVSNLNKLERLSCSFNNLRKLNIQNGANELINTLYAQQNPDLHCIQVDDPEYSSLNWEISSNYDFDHEMCFSNDCYEEVIEIPDANFEQALIDLGIDSDMSINGQVLIGDIKCIQFLDVASKNIVDITGIEYFESLSQLGCAFNQIEKVDFSNNKDLFVLNIAHNKLGSLDLSANTSLGLLYCDYNQIKGLDLSNNNLIDNLAVNNNRLQSLNLKNGANTIINTFSALNNPDLECIEVDDVEYSSNNWTNIDSQSYFSDNCGLNISVSNVSSFGDIYDLELENPDKPLLIAADGSNSTHFLLKGENLEFVRMVIQTNAGGSSSHPNLYGSFEELELKENSKKIIYNHPKYYNHISNEQNLPVTLKVYNSITSETLETYTIYLVRPSLHMVHGIWSYGADAFKTMKDSLLIEGMYVDQQLNYISYRSSNSNIENFDDYKFGITKLKNRAKDANISMEKVDVIAHSNGGLLSRQYIQSPDYENDINKLITFNTPHSGSQFANILRDPNYDWLGNAIYNFTILNFEPKDATKGIIADIRVGEWFINNLNANINRKNKYKDIGIHTITTTETLQNISGNIVHLLATLLLKADVLLSENVFMSPFHDIIVSKDSQIGGVVTTSNFKNQIHMGSTANTETILKAIELLNQNPNDPNYFSHEINPVSIPLPKLPGLENKIYQNKSAQTEIITITNPDQGDSFKAGSSLSISVEGSNGIKNIVSAMGDGIVPLQTHITEENNKENFSFEIPENAIGRLNILSFGFSEKGYEDFASTYIMVTTDAILDSIEIDEQLIYVSEGSESIITILGKYNDGVVRNITNLEGLVYSFENENAELSSNGLITGLNEGEDLLTVDYLGKTTTIPITVVSSISLSDEDIIIDNNTFSVYPNPFKNSLKVGFPSNEFNAEVEIFTLLGQFVSSMELDESKNKIDLSYLESGMYLIKIYTGSNSITKRIIKQ